VTLLLQNHIQSVGEVCDLRAGKFGQGERGHAGLFTERSPRQPCADDGRGYPDENGRNTHSGMSDRAHLLAPVGWYGCLGGIPFGWHRPFAEQPYCADCGWVSQPVALLDPAPVLQKTYDGHERRVLDGHSRTAYRNASEWGWIIQGGQADLTGRSFREILRRGTLVVPDARQWMIKC